jgi:hypothetical protein
MPNPYNPAETAHNQGRGSVTTEEAIGLRGKVAKKKKNGALVRLAKRKSRLTEEGQAPPEVIAEYNRLGGSKTKEGMEYRRKWMEGR